MRLNKYLSDAGVCSRRQADRLVEEGRVRIDDHVALLGEQVEEGQRVFVDGEEAILQHKKIILAFHKPKGIVCTAEKREKNNIIDYIHYPERIYPMGRLDKESEGLILLTNDGELMNEILRARNYHEKEYEVKVDRPVTKDFLRRMSQGVEILDTVTRPCEVRQTGMCSFRIVLTQGLNRQIRRMCEALGYRVRDLKRYRIMNIHLGDLESGKYRQLTPQEYEELLRLTGRAPAAKENPLQGSRKKIQKMDQTEKVRASMKKRWKSDGAKAGATEKKRWKGDGGKARSAAKRPYGKAGRLEGRQKGVHDR